MMAHSAHHPHNPISRLLRVDAGEPLLQHQSDVSEHVPGFKQMRADLVSREAAMMACPVELDGGRFAVFCLPDQVGLDIHNAVRHMLRARSKHMDKHADVPSYRVSAQLLLTLVRERLDGRALKSWRVGSEETSAVRKMFRDVVAWSVRQGASDIHLNVHEGDRASEVRVTIDGHYIAPEHLQMNTDRLLEMCKVAWLDSTGGKHALFDPRIEQQSRLWDVVDGKVVLLRWGSFITDRGPSVTMRVLVQNADEDDPHFAQLGYLPSQVRAIEAAMHTEGGAIILGGVVGSGKSTTIACQLNQLPSWRKLMTLEDPVERQIRGALQASIVRDLGQDDEDNFGPKLMMLKRSAPTDVLLGEIRDRQTGRAFQDIVEAGTNVSTTVHVGSVTGIAARLASAQIGVALDVLAAPGILKLLIYQALLPQLCRCALPLAALGDGAPDAMGRSRNAAHWRGFLSLLTDLYGDHVQNIRVRNPAGCPHCQTRGLPQIYGYQGRTVAAEHFAPADHKAALRAIAQRDWVALAEIHASTSDQNPASAEMQGKSAMQCAVYKMLHGQLDPRDIEPRFRPFSTLKSPSGGSLTAQPCGVGAP